MSSSLINSARAGVKKSADDSDEEERREDDKGVLERREKKRRWRERRRRRGRERRGFLIEKTGVLTRSVLFLWKEEEKSRREEPSRPDEIFLKNCPPVDERLVVFFETMEGFDEDCSEEDIPAVPPDGEEKQRGSWRLSDVEESEKKSEVEDLKL